jgi:predicted nucleic acid-binding Zn ribbon protein
MGEKRKTSKKFTHIGEILQETLQGCRRETNETLAALGACWPEVVGEILGANSSPAAMKGKMLLVHVSSSVWLQEMRFLKADVLEAANRILEGEKIQDVRFKVGRV